MNVLEFHKHGTIQERKATVLSRFFLVLVKWAVMVFCWAGLSLKNIPVRHEFDNLSITQSW